MTEACTKNYSKVENVYMIQVMIVKIVWEGHLAQMVEHTTQS